jgi:hypothetical protein
MASMDLDTYKKALEDKSEIPSFAPAVKTQYSRNITVEDWNSVIYSVQGLLSDMYATSEFLMDNTAYQLQYSSTNVRGYYGDLRPDDLASLASGQLFLISQSQYLPEDIELYKARGDGGMDGPMNVALVGNRPYFVYTKENYSPSKKVQSVGTGLVSYFYDENNKERVVYGTDGVADGYGFFVNVLDANANYSGAISFGAKTYKFAYDNLVDVFSSDGNTTAIKSPMGSASVSLTNGAANVYGYSVYIGPESKGTSGDIQIGSAIKMTSGGAVVRLSAMGNMTIDATLLYIYSPTSFSEAPSYGKGPTDENHLTNKRYVDATASARATEKANAEQERAEYQEGYLQSQINAINASQNFVATFATHAELANIDISSLDKSDCVLILKDEDHQDQSTVYRYIGGSSGGVLDWFEFIGELGDYYTKAHVDAEFAKTNGNVAYYRSQTESYAKKVDAYTNSTDDKIAELGKVVDTAKDAYLASTPTFVETSSSTEESDVTPTLVGLFAETSDEAEISE